MIDPLISRLSSDYKKAKKLASKSPFVHINKTQGDPPKFYEILFTCKGIKQILDGKLEFSEHHLFEISLGPEYPTKKPSVVCTTKIFHPNISTSGTVCIGDEWTSGGRYLDDLIIYLAQMIRYEGLDLVVTKKAYNLSAYEWANNNRHLLPIDKRPLYERGVVILDSRLHAKKDTPNHSYEIKVIAKR
jgi:ubiquitin-protein ligase